MSFIYNETTETWFFPNLEHSMKDDINIGIGVR